MARQLAGKDQTRPEKLVDCRVVMGPVCPGVLLLRLRSRRQWDRFKFIELRNIKDVSGRICTCDRFLWRRGDAVSTPSAGEQSSVG